jgi:hypothetical protein
MRALFGDASSVDQVIVEGFGAEVTAEIERGSTIRNSVLLAFGANGSALETASVNYVATSTYRNVTAIATGSGGVAIQARAWGVSGNVTVNLVNVIAEGGPGGTGLKAHTDSSGGYAMIIANHTSYQGGSKVGSNAAIIDLAGNQSLFPSFVGSAVSDYHQTSASPTLNAGLDNPVNGALDVDGDPRTIGTTDIGADELVVAPAATTGAAGAVTDLSATLGALTPPHGAPTSYRFQLGPTTAYGSTTPSTAAGSGTGTVVAVAALAGLSPARTYHYRLVATNAGGVTNGADRTFTTASAPPTQTSPDPSTRPFAGVTLVSTRLSFGGRSITLKLSCPAGTVDRCSGRGKLTARHRRPGTSTGRRVLLGRAGFTIATGNQANVKVRVSRAGRRLLARVRRLRGTETNAARDGAAHSKTTVVAVEIRRRHR